MALMWSICYFIFCPTYITIQACELVLFVLAICQSSCGIFLTIHSKSNRSTIRRYLSDKFLPTSAEGRHFWKRVQSFVHCCGLDGPSDWLQHHQHSNGIPTECCDESSTASSECTVDAAYEKGCVEELADYLEIFDLTLGSIGIVTGLIYGSFSGFCWFRNRCLMDQNDDGGRHQ